MQDSTNRSRKETGGKGLRSRLLRLQPKAPVKGLKTEVKATKAKVKASKVKFKAARSTHQVFVEPKLRKANTVRPNKFCARAPHTRTRLLEELKRIEDN